TKAADKEVISAGEQAGFTVTLTNRGPGDAFGVTLSDPLPSGVAWAIDAANSDTGFTIVTDAGGRQVLSFDQAVLLNGASRRVHVVGVTDAADRGTLTNTVTASASNEPSDVLGNNTATADIVVNCPDLVVTKVPDRSVISAGEQAGFTITVTNLGPGDAFDVSLIDLLPPGV